MTKTFLKLAVGFALVIWLVIIFQSLAPHREMAGSAACIGNLWQLNAAAKQFALEHQLTNGSSINYPNDLTPYVKLNSAGTIPGCPAGGTYHLTKVGEAPTCSLGTTVTPAHVLPR